MTATAQLGSNVAPLPPRGLRIGFFLMFLVPSLIATWYVLAVPLWGLATSHQWEQIECEVLQSTTQTSRGTDGKTTSPTLKITYRYEYAGRIHVVDDIDFFGGFAVREAVILDFLDRFPTNIHRPCFVNPSDPTQCVLDRDFRAAYLLGLIPLLFCLVLCGALRHILWPPAEPAPVASSGVTTLAPLLSPRQRVAVAFFVSAFILGIMAAVSGAGALLGFPLIFATLAGIGWVGYQLLALANPVPHITVSTTSVALGDRFELTWRIDGNTRRLRNLRISLECDEFITTTTKGSRRTRVERRVTVPIHGDTIALTGTATVQIPDDAPTSYRSSNHHQLWRLRFRGDIPRWPDLSEQYEITVLSAAPQS